MKTNFTILAFLFSFQFILAQDIPNAWFNEVNSITCPFDNNETILTPDYWIIYQTQNGQWDGIVDSTKCISVTQDGFNVKIALDQIDISKPLFIRCQLDDNNKILLEPNSLFNASFQFSVAPEVQLNLNEDCDNGLCSGLILGVEIPDSSGLGTDLRMYSTSAISSFFCDASFCYASEKFPENYLKEVILKLTIENEAITDEWVRLQDVSHYMNYVWSDGFRIYDMEVPESFYQDTSYDVNIGYFSDYQFTSLIMYKDTTYPSPQNPSHVEAYPSPNVPTQEWINLKVYQGESLLFQPYAYLRGGLVENNDSLRHHLNLINDGGEFCIDLIEVVFSNEDRFTHKSGDLNFHGTTSCMMFRYGGELKIAQNAFLQYGDGGEGILALGKQSKVNLETGSTLVIDNKVLLLDIVDNVDDQIKVDLQPGSAMIFGDNARIIRSDGSQGNQIINVYMNGGVLDDHKLTNEERMMINKIYPKSNQTHLSEPSLLIYPNPVNAVLTCRYISLSEQLAEVEVMNLNGQLIYNNSKFLVEGINDIVLNIDIPKSGIFILKLTTKEGQISGKFVK
jgi:type IX secretion system substrate protein